MVDTYFYIDASRRIRSKNGDPNDNLFYIEGKHIYGPRNSGYFWIEDNRIISDYGDTGFRIQAGQEIFGPSQHVPWLT